MLLPPQPTNIPIASRPSRAVATQKVFLPRALFPIGRMKRPARPSPGKPVQYASRNGVAGRCSTVAVVSPVAKVKLEGKGASSPAAISEEGLKEQVECAGRPVQVSPIVPTKVLPDVTVRLTVARLPLLSETDVDAKAREKSVVPVPVSDTESAGFMGSEVAMASDAELAPATAGLNITAIAQLAAGANAAPQLLVWAKAAGFVPVIAMLPIVMNAAPPFVRVTV